MNKHTPSLRTLNALRKRMIQSEFAMLRYWKAPIPWSGDRPDGSFFMQQWMDGFNYAMKLARKIAKEKP